MKPKSFAVSPVLVRTADGRKDDEGDDASSSNNSNSLSEKGPLEVAVEDTSSDYYYFDSVLADCKVELVDHHEIPPVRRCHFTAVAATGVSPPALYLMGGTTDAGRKTTFCERLFLNDEEGPRRWETWRIMNHSARAHCCAILSSHRVYVLGGVAFTGLRPACAEYTSLTTSTTRSGSRRFDYVAEGGPDGRYRGSAAVIKGHHIYFMGGFLSVSGEYSQRVSLYDMIRRRWLENEVPDLPTKRAWCAATTLDNSIYVVGGTSSYSSLSSPALTVLSSNHSRPVWIELPPMRYGRYECAAVTVGRCIVVLGGRSSDGEKSVILDSVEAYEVDTAQWIPLRPLLQPRAGFAAVMMSANEIVVMGGYNHEGGRTSLVSTVERITIELDANLAIRRQEKAQQSRKLKTLSPVDQWMSEVSQIKAECQASLEGTTRRLCEAQEMIQSQHQMIQHEVQRHEQSASRLYQTLQRVQHQAKDAMEVEDEEEHKKFKALLAAVAEAHEVLQDLGGMRKGGERMDATTAGAVERVLVSSSSPASPPNELLCPITLEVMEDPVMTCDGMTYERRAIERYFASKKWALSPKTGQPLATRTLIPNIAIRNMCHDYLTQVAIAGAGATAAAAANGEKWQ